MERNDEEQIDFSERIMDGANGRHHDAGGFGVALAEHRHAKILMPVVPARDDLIIADEEYPPAADAVADGVPGLESAIHDLAGRRSFQPERSYDRVADDQQQFQHQRRMPEDGGIDVHYSEARPRQRRAVGIVEIGVLD